MGSLTIVGGVYIERCVEPLWDAVFGSAGRAMIAVSGLVTGATLVTYVDDATRDAAEALARECGGTLEAHKTARSIRFDYFHPLSVPIIRPAPGVIRNAPIHVTGDVVLRYGMLEGDAVVNANVAIYDPQSAFGAQAFTANGSTAKRLAIVLNKAEALSMSGLSNARSAALALLQSEDAEVVVLKQGPAGALVLTREGEATVPLYKTSSVWKLGSGDVFSATFAALWGCVGLDPVNAADCASRATAYYCDTRSLPPPGVAELMRTEYMPLKAGTGTVYLASPFFDLGQRWVVEEAYALLSDMGANVFSPVHAVGPGPADIVAGEDIAGLERSDVVFAILNGMDAGTVFEVGYAVKKGIPVVALAQNVKDEDLKMIVGNGCQVVVDFASAIYRTIWSLPA